MVLKLRKSNIDFGLTVSHLYYNRHVLRLRYRLDCFVLRLSINVCGL